MLLVFIQSLGFYITPALLGGPQDVMLGELKVMDQTAITLCKENSLPLIVLNIHQNGAVARAIRGEAVGTLVR